MITINTQPTQRQLRQFAGIWFPLMSVVLGLLLFEKLGFPRAAFGLWGFAALVAIAGLLRPAAIRWLFVGMIIATFPIGFVISHLMLVVLYYLVLTPLGLGLRLLGKDPLSKKPDPDAATYWVPRAEPDEVERYFRQY